MARRKISKRSKAKTILRLPDLEQSKVTVLHSLAATGKRACVNENSAQVGMSRQVFIDLGCQCLEVFRRQRRKGLDDQNAFGLQNLVLDHVWFTVMKAKTASTGISGLVPNSPRMVKKLIFASKEWEFPRTKAHAASRS
jgi:hypothetical protein